LNLSVRCVMCIEKSGELLKALSQNNFSGHFESWKAVCSGVQHLMGTTLKGNTVELVYNVMKVTIFCFVINGCCYNRGVYCYGLQ
jgi:hypothetical protein